MLLEAGVDWVGYPLRLPVNKEDISEAMAAEIIGDTSTERSVLITYLATATEILELARYLQVKKVQLHGEIKVKELEKLRNSQPDLKIIKSLVVGLLSASEISETIHYTYPYVDYYITDTYNPQTGASGATGLTHDWRISREIVEVSPRPVILAGGLTAENVAEAVAAVRPFGVDVHTGVENEKGEKSPALVKKFVKNARHAFSSLTATESVYELNTDTLDLHNFHPKDAKNLVCDFIDFAVKKGYPEIRIIHGKGKGVLRDIVHSELKKNKNVQNYRLANDRFSSWGATIVKLFGK